MKSRAPLRYSYPGTPWNGVSLTAADRTFNDKLLTFSLGAGSYSGPLASGSGGGWTCTNGGTGTGTVAQNTSGQHVITSGAATPTDEDFTQLQYLNQPFRWHATLNLACFARVAVSHATATDAFVGLAASDTSLIAASVEGVSDCIAFFKAATPATALDFLVQASGTTTTTSTGLTVVADQFMVLGFTIIAGAIRMYAVQDASDQVRTNPRLLGTGTSVANTNAPANTVSLFVSLLAGIEGATARTLTTDWMFVSAVKA